VVPERHPGGGADIVPLNLQLPGKHETCNTFSTFGFADLDVRPRIRFFAAMTESSQRNAVLGRADRKPAPADGSKQQLVPAAKRALAEAQARRAEIDRKSKERPRELHGRNGPEPTRYGDWEVKGIASDF
jgi:hypothetical protein